MSEAFICDFVRTPIGRYEGGLSRVRTDDLAAAAIRHLVSRNAAIGAAVDEVFLGCANQAGEDNRNVARMALLLGGLPAQVPGVTLNRLCASGLDAVAAAARAIRAGEIELAVAGGVESMTRAPFVMGKAERAFQRTAEIYDTTIGWRFVNRADEGCVRRGFDAGNRRERRRGVQRVARGPGRLRLSLATARRTRSSCRRVRRADRGRDRARGQEWRRPIDRTRRATSRRRPPWRRSPSSSP